MTIEIMYQYEFFFFNFEILISILEINQKVRNCEFFYKNKINNQSYLDNMAPLKENN